LLPVREYHMTISWILFVKLRDDTTNSKYTRNKQPCKESFRQEK
jgi:hypothetical protein